MVSSSGTRNNYLLPHQLSYRRRLAISIKQSKIGKILADYIGMVGRSQCQDFQQVRQFRAALESMDFADTHMTDARVVRDKFAVLDMALGHAPPHGLYLEFGVWSGNTINFIAERHAGAVHGFDSFEGLPENWYANFRKGEFATMDWMPKVRPNVHLHKGWFEETLPGFVREHTEPVAFLHVDCDLYSSTRTIFQHLADQIIRGTVIVFDEYFNYPGWQNHEHKAFQEFLADRNLSARFLCYNETECNAAAIIV
jgi:hypothetical protein